MEIVEDTPTSQYVTPASSGSSAPLPEAAASGGARWIDVDLTNQTVYAYQGDTVVNSFLVSTGTWLHPTVTGQYNIYVKYRSAPMSGPGYYLPNVPYIMYFYKGYGLHGTYWHSNFGTPMSHGCVNLRTDEAAWLYNWASVGTLVNVHY
jgi:lipoprotein-anchoring transpeptidase ErfK/SrfK